MSNINERMHEDEAMDKPMAARIDTPNKFLEFSCQMCKGEGRVTCGYKGQADMDCPLCGGKKVPNA